MFFLLSIFVISSKPKPYHGQDCSSFASILRDEISKDAVLELDQPLDFTLFAGDQVESIDYSHSFHQGTGPDNFTLTNVPQLRKYFQLVTNKGKCLLSDKHLPLEKSFNFRDLGGIRTKDGRHVKWGKLFRSDEIFNFTAQDKSYINSIPLQTVVDFRDKNPVARKPDDKISPEYILLGIEVGYVVETMNNISLTGQLTGAFVSLLMKDMYHKFVTQPDYVDRFREFFTLLQNSVYLPLLFHCTSGKDRTGTAAYFIYSSLGVSQDVIEADYLLTNKYYLHSRNLTEEDPEYYLYVADLDYLHTAINAINENYGSVEKFLTGTLNVNLTLMKELYLD